MRHLLQIFVFLVCLQGCSGESKKFSPPPANEALLVSGVTFSDCEGCPELVVVPSGSFSMYSRADRSRSLTMAINSFAMGKFEITRAQWKLLMGTNPSKYRWDGLPAEGDSLPIDEVSWNEAQEFVKRLSAKTGKTYRLPSDAEWEFAARAGSKEVYEMSDMRPIAKRLENFAWFSNNSGGRPHPVGQKLPNAFGLYDMLGNISEWMEDCSRDAYFYNIKETRDPNSGDGPLDNKPWVVAGCEGASIRGGSFNSSVLEAIPSSFLRANKASRASSLGFRVARELDKPFTRPQLSLSAGELFKDCDYCPEMVVMPAGDFLMGLNEDRFASLSAEYDEFLRPWLLHERPQHRVTVRAFAIGKFEVTQEQWEAVMGASQSEFTGIGTPPSNLKGRQLPELVSWVSAKEFVKKLSVKTGKTYRLPSEAEWEYAALAGSQANYSFGDDQLQLTRFAWFVSNSAKTMHPVGGKLPNAFGLYDMHGNVWEWTEDCWNKSYEGAPSDGSAWIRGDCTLRVGRGGTWGDQPQFLRAGFRGGLLTIRSSGSGFRIARDLP